MASPLRGDQPFAAGYGARRTWSVPTLGDGEGGPDSPLAATHSCIVFSIFLLLLLFASKP
jgi:hypothetical protein